MFSSTRLRALTLPLAVVIGLLSGSALLAQEEIANDAEEAAAKEEWAGPKVTFHGYLTQAYGQTDGHQILGLTEDGTADYRTAALQVRADIAANDAFVVQFSHERIGNSPIQSVKEDVGLDWIFYEHRFENSAIKVGRVQIPFGIYNEILDVGTLLPFYRPSHNFYGDGAFSSETVDGVVVSHNFDLGQRWGLEADLHAGNFRFPETDFQGNVTLAEVDDSLGVELWLDTPVSGLRIGTGGMRYDIDDVNFGKARWELYHVSLAGDFDRFSFHAEHKNTDIGFFDVLFYYAHLGLKVTDKVEVNAQNDLLYFDGGGFRRTKADDDLALGVNYFFRSELVIKTEHHWNEGSFWLEDLRFLPPGAAIPKTRYWLVSLSTSF